MYPDDYRGRYNFAYFAHNDALRSAEAREMIGEAEAVHNPARASAAFLAGELDLVLNRYDSAIAQFEKAESFGVSGTRRPYVETYLALRRYTDAARIAKLQRATGGPAQDFEARLYEVAMPLDRGQWQAALDAAAALDRETARAGQNHVTRSIFAVTGLTLRAYAPDAAFAADLRAYVRRVAAELEGSDSLLRRRLLFEVLATGWMAASTGDVALASKQLALAEGEPLVDAYPASAAMQRILQAEIALASADPAAAIARLEADVKEEAAGLYFSRAVLMRAYLAAGRERDAAALADWLAENRGRAFAEPNSIGLWQAANIIESNLALRTGAQLAERGGHERAARAKADAFAAAWPQGESLPAVQRRDDAL